MIGFGPHTLHGGKIKPITTLQDPRLVEINPQEACFFDNVLYFNATHENIKSFIEKYEDKEGFNNFGNYINSATEKIKKFIEAVVEVKVASIEPFYRVIYDPIDVGDYSVGFQKGYVPAILHDYNWWCETASKMAPVEGRQWNIMTEAQYYIFLVWLINRLVKSGKFVVEALYLVVVNSTDLGNYNHYGFLETDAEFEDTGSRYCGVFDLVNTSKYLQPSNSEEGAYWLVEASYEKTGIEKPLADITYRQHFESEDCMLSVGLLVLQ